MKKRKQMTVALAVMLCLLAGTGCGTSYAEITEEIQEESQDKTQEETQSTKETSGTEGKKGISIKKKQSVDTAETAHTADTVQTDDAEEDEYTVIIPVLTGGALPFTHMKNLCTANNPDGGYYYVDMTEDGTIRVFNYAFASELGNYQGDILEYMTWAGPSLGADEAYDIVVEENQTYSEKMGCPVFIITFTTGTNEDMRYWTAYAAEAYGYTYLYEFSVWAEESDGMDRIIQNIFDRLYLPEM